MVLDEPKIWLVPGFVSNSEVDHLLSLAECAGAWAPSVVWRGGNPSERTSSSFMLCSAQTPIVRAIEHRVAALAGVPVQQVERLSLVRYLPGQHFGEHHDGRDRPKTVFVYLNDVEGEGGETCFPRLGVKLKPVKGCAAFWHNNSEDGTQDDRMVHKGLPPLVGIKYAMNCFICTTLRGAATNYGTTDDPMPSYWTRSSVGVRAIRELSLHKLAETSMVGSENDADCATKNSLRLCRLHVSSSPWFRCIPSLLNSSEVSEILAACGHDATWSAAHISSGQGTSEFLNRPSVPFEKEVAMRLEALLQLEPGRVENVRVERYSPGQYTFERHAGPDNTYSILVYLDEVPEGEDGASDFRHCSFQFRPLTGAAMIWRNCWEDGGIDERLKHSEMPLVSTTRHHLTCHVRAVAAMAGHMKRDQRWDSVVII